MQTIGDNLHFNLKLTVTTAKDNKRACKNMLIRFCKINAHSISSTSSSSSACINLFEFGEAQQHLQIRSIVHEYFTYWIWRSEHPNQTSNLNEWEK